MINTFFKIIKSIIERIQSELVDKWSKDYIIRWPQRYNPLPAGYTVWWVECIEHYMGIGPFEAESPIYSSRYAARNWCFAHYENKKNRGIDFE